MQIEAEVNATICIGNGSCRQEAPLTFLEMGNGRSTTADQAGDPVDSIMAAAELCPVAAITVFDSDTREELA